MYLPKTDENMYPQIDFYRNFTAAYLEEKAPARSQVLIDSGTHTLFNKKDEVWIYSII